MPRNSFLSLIKPSLHVGKHSLGGFGCSASAGSGGIGGAGATTGKGKLALQAATSNSGTNSSALQIVDFLPGMFNLLLHGRGAAVPFVDRGTNCAARLSFPVHPLVSHVQLGQAQAIGLQRREGAHHQHARDGSLGDHASPLVAGAEPICRETWGTGQDSGQR